MKKETSRTQPKLERDTLRPEYDFRGATRGVTSLRFEQGTNLFLIDPDVLDVFPDEASVSEALRALAVIVRKGRSRPKRKTS